MKHRASQGRAGEVKQPRDVPANVEGTSSVAAGLPSPIPAGKQGLTTANEKRRCPCLAHSLFNKLKHFRLHVSTHMSEVWTSTSCVWTTSGDSEFHMPLANPHTSALGAVERASQDRITTRL